VWSDAHPASNTFTFTDASSDTTSYAYSEDGGAWQTVTGSTATLNWDPASGYHTLAVKAQDHANNIGATTTFTFGDGHPTLSVLQPRAMTARYLPVSANGPNGASSAYLMWKPASSSTWTRLDPSRVSANGTGWNGSVSTTSDGTASVTPSLVWDSIDVPGAPLTLNLQACFTYPSLGDNCSPVVSVLRVAHAFGGSFAVAGAGPGQLALSTGELQITATDAKLPGYADDLSVTRSYLSFTGNAGGHSGFGPGWSSTLPAPDAGALDSTVVDHLTAGGNTDGTIDLLTPDGETDVYTDPSWRAASDDPRLRDTTSTITLAYTDENGVNTDGSTLTISPDKQTLTLTDPDGTRTEWTRSNTTSTSWTAKDVIEPGSQGSETVTSGSYTDSDAANGTLPPGAAVGDSWTTTITHARDVDCSHGVVAGCRALTVVTAPDDPTLQPAPGTTGAFRGQIRETVYTAYDPDRTIPDPADPTRRIAAPGMTSVVAGVYSYDSNGRLVATYDPRADVTTGQHLVTKYAYDSQGRLTSLTPPGQQPWQFTYNTTSGDPHEGWLLKVTRHDPDLNGGSDDVTHYVYGVPLSGDGLPDLTAGAVTAWGQPTSDAPTTAVAIFPPDHTVSDTPGTSDWPYASISYLDGIGRGTNTAAYGQYGDGTSGWQVATTVYDNAGRVASTLTAANRAVALNASPTNCPATVPALVCGQAGSALRAQLLSTVNIYGDQKADGSSPGTGDPAELTDTYGPATLVTPAGSSTPVTVRGHTHTDYDEGAPTPPPNGPDKWRLPTTVTTSGYQLDGLTDPTKLGDPAAAAVEPRQTVNGYDPLDPNTSPTDPSSGWVLGKPTSVTVDPGSGHLAITTRTVYNADGNPVQQRQPRSDGSDAGTTKTVYYSTGANTDDPSCGNHPEWDGLACTSGPAAQPSGQPIPVTRYTKYSILLQPEQTQETSGPTVRTTDTSYDGVGRTHTQHVSEDPVTGDQPLPEQTFGYEPSTGLPTTISTSQGTITASYDSLGRLVTQTDGTGANTATTHYDADSRPSNVTDAKGSYTYSYDGNGEHRGLVTDVDTGVGAGLNSHITVTYDANGSPAVETYPNGVVATRSIDPAGELTALKYVDHSGATIAAWTLAYSSTGQISLETGPSAAGARSQTYSYDNAARLTRTADTRGDTCTIRSYSFDANSNRTGQSTWTGTPAAGCPDTTTTATNSRTASYDTADRITDATVTTGGIATPGSYAYGTLGRVTTNPSVDATAGTGSGDITLRYYVNDLAYSETQGSTTRTFTLDPAQRLAGWTDSSPNTSSTVTNHYDDTGDSPDWTDNGDGSWTRNITGPDGNLAIIVTGDGNGTKNADIQIINPHGDVTTAIPDTANVAANQATAINDTDEFGNPLTPNVPRYNWLGGKQRSTDATTGLIQMGVRLYNPASGRFLQPDPIPGGSANDYDYANQDPLNSFDLDGKCVRGFGWACRAGSAIKHGAAAGYHWAGHHKLDIALTAASFALPEVAAFAWTTRALRLARWAEEAAGTKNAVTASRALSRSAGRVWTGRGARWSSDGRRLVGENGRQWRPPTYKGRRGWESNFDEPGGATAHVRHRSPTRFMPWL
jgi:RHS repeat-associated protein